MANVMVDTCVVFCMKEYLRTFASEKNIPFTDLLKNLGSDNQLKQELIENIDRSVDTVEFIETYFKENKDFQAIEKLMPEEIFFAKSESMNPARLPFDKRIRLYEKYYQNFEKQINSDRLALERNPNYPTEKLVEMNERAKVFAKLKVHYDALENDLRIYKGLERQVNGGVHLTFSNSCYVVRLLKDCLEGKVNLFTNPSSFAEILYHTDGTDEEHVSKKVLNRDEVLLLTKLFNLTLVTTKSDKIKNMIDDLSRLYLKDPEEAYKLFTGNEPDKTIKHKLKSMKIGKDINSFGEVGDPKIAAWASLAGINLLTTNVKDYISYSVECFDNEIRNYIDFVNEYLQKKTGYTTNANSYSPTEFYDKNIYREVSEKNNQLIDLQNKDQEYEGQEFFEYFDYIKEIG